MRTLKPPVLTKDKIRGKNNKKLKAAVTMRMMSKFAREKTE